MAMGAFLFFAGLELTIVGFLGLFSSEIAGLFEIGLVLAPLGAAILAYGIGSQPPPVVEEIEEDEETA
jgi:hypothetical protein